MGGFLDKLNKPKTLVVVLVLTLVVDSLLLYRYRLMEPPATAAVPVLTVNESGAAPTEAATAFAAPVGHKGPSRAKNTGGETQLPSGEREGAFLAATWGSALAPLPPQAPYLPVSYRPAPAPWTSQSAPLVASLTASPTTEGPAPAVPGEPREQGSDAASPTAPATKPAPANQVPAHREPAEAAPAVTAPAPRDLVTAPTRQNPIGQNPIGQNPIGQNPIAPPGIVPAQTEPTTAPLESTEQGSTTPQPPLTEKTQLPPAPSSQAQCRDGGFAAFGFEDQDECTSFVVARGKKEPGNKNQVK